MMNELKEILIEGVKYHYDAEKEYIKDGHAYCIICHKRKDSDVMDLFGSKKIFKIQCDCDSQRLEKEEAIKKELEIQELKRRCFNSMS